MFCCHRVDNDVSGGLKLTNPEILQNNLQRKLFHLTVEEQDDMENLLLEFQQIFPYVPSSTTYILHDIDVNLHCLVSNIHTE